MKKNILVVVESEKQLDVLRVAFQNNSDYNFIYERDRKGAEGQVPNCDGLLIDGSIKFDNENVANYQHDTSNSGFLALEAIIANKPAIILSARSNNEKQLIKTFRPSDKQQILQDVEKHITPIEKYDSMNLEEMIKKHTGHDFDHGENYWQVLGVYPRTITFEDEMEARKTGKIPRMEGDKFLQSLTAQIDASPKSIDAWKISLGKLEEEIKLNERPVENEKPAEKKIEQPKIKIQ